MRVRKPFPQLIALHSQHIRGKRRAIAIAKSTTLAFRIEPGLKEALRTVAAREHRSIANMVEVLIRDYCGRNGIAIAEQDDLSVRPWPEAG